MYFILSILSFKISRKSILYFYEEMYFIVFIFPFNRIIFLNKSCIVLIPKSFFLELLFKNIFKYNYYKNISLKAKRMCFNTSTPSFLVFSLKFLKIISLNCEF